MSGLSEQAAGDVDVWTLPAAIFFCTMGMFAGAARPLFVSAATLIWGIHPWQRGLVHVADLHELTSRVLQRQMLTRALLQLAYRGQSGSAQ
jgi:hypothetical protein